MSDENVFYYRGGEVYDTSITKVVVASGVTKIYYDAFRDCRELQSVVFEEPHQVTEIGHSAWDDCHALKSIELPKSLMKIGSWAFGRCHALRRIVIPRRVTSIDLCAFAGSGIEEIFLSDGIKSITNRPCSLCPRLHTVRLPASIQKIEYRVFASCENLKKVIVPADGLPRLKRLGLDGYISSRGWEVVCTMARKAPNLTSLSLSGVRVGGSIGHRLDDGDIPLVIEMVSSCPHLKSLDLSHNAFSHQAIRTLDSEGILARLRHVNFIRNRGTESMLSANQFLNLLQKNPHLTIWTNHKWEHPEDEVIHHYLDMNRCGSRGVPITNASVWPRLIDRLNRMHRLETCSANVLYHLLSIQNLNIYLRNELQERNGNKKQ